MEKTLTIDDDVLTAAEKIAEQQQKSIDQVISDLSREGLSSTRKRRFSIDDIPTLPLRDPTPVTVEFVRELRDRLGE